MSFALCSVTCPALDIIHCSAKFNLAGCFPSECPAMQDLDMQWIQNLASSMSASNSSSAENLGEARPAPVSPAMTVTQLANMRRFSGNHSHAASILSSALQHCECGTSDFFNPAYKCALHHNLGDLLRERQQYDECKTQLDRADSCFPANFLNDFEAFLVASPPDRERLLQESDVKRSMFAEIAAVMATRARLLENQNLLEEAEKLFNKSLNALRVSFKLLKSGCV